MLAWGRNALVHPLTSRPFHLAVKASNQAYKTTEYNVCALFDSQQPVTYWHRTAEIRRRGRLGFVRSMPISFVLAPQNVPFFLFFYVNFRRR